MTWLEFVSSLVDKILSWPVVALVVAVMFRRELGDLARRLRNTRLFGQDLSFGDGVERAEEATAEAVADVETRAELGERDQNEVIARALMDPSLLIIGAFEDLAEELSELHTSRGLTPRFRNPVGATKQLRFAGVVNEAFVESVEELSALRNKVAHARYVPTAGEAEAYAETAQDLRRAAAALRIHLPSVHEPPRP